MYPNPLRLNNRYFLLLFCTCCIFIYSCSDTDVEKTAGADSRIELSYPFGFDTMRFPDDNRLTAARIELGKKIFFDPQFSADKKISCSSCHKPEFAFADTIKTHKGSHDSTNNRNSPSLINIGYHPYFDYDGGVPTLELQVLVPFDGENEMHGNLLTAAKQMQKDKKYVALVKEAYKRQPDPYVNTRALAAYQRTLISTGSNMICLKYGRQKRIEFGRKKGMELFFFTKTNVQNVKIGPLVTKFRVWKNSDYPTTVNERGPVTGEKP